MKTNLLYEEENDEHVLLIDGHNTIFRTVFAAQTDLDKEKILDPNFTMFKIYFLNAMKTLVDKFNPTKIILAIDSNNGWRKNVYKEYKGKRKALRDASAVDFDAFFKILDPFLDDFKKVFKNLYVLKIDEAEGDDIIAIACENIKDKITIVSVDKDFYQLQKFKNVSQYNPIKRSMVKSINPERDLQIKIIGGDDNDNIPAIFPRCGEKTVEKLLNENFILNLHDQEYIENNRNKLIERCKISPEDVLKNYIRNTELIDFKHIPLDIRNRIKEQLNEPCGKFDGRKFMTFIIKHDLKPILERASDYTNTLGRI